MNSAVSPPHALSPSLQRLADLWEKLRGECDLPRRSDFHPTDASWLLGHLYLVDVLDGGEDYFYRLSGTVVKEIYGLELQGKRLGTLRKEKLKQALRTNYETVIATRRPMAQRGRLSWPNGSHIGIERLLLPFTDDDGNPCTILGAVVCDVPLETLVLYRSDGQADMSSALTDELEPV
jgi:hypothetical protein